MGFNRRTLLSSAGAGTAIGMTNGFWVAAANAADDAARKSPNQSHEIVV